jgi:hypothetical protein
VTGVQTCALPILTDTSLGTEDFTSNGFSIYPNPASDSFTIKNSNLTEIKQLLLYDTSGKLVMTRYPTTVESTTVETSNLQQGLYFVAIEAPNGSVFRTKLQIR